MFLFLFALAFPFLLDSRSQQHSYSLYYIDGRMHGHCQNRQTHNLNNYLGTVRERADLVTHSCQTFCSICRVKKHSDIFLLQIEKAYDKLITLKSRLVYNPFTTQMLFHDRFKLKRDEPARSQNNHGIFLSLLLTHRNFIMRKYTYYFYSYVRGLNLTVLRTIHHSSDRQMFFTYPQH